MAHMDPPGLPWAPWASHVLPWAPKMGVPAPPQDDGRQPATKMRGIVEILKDEGAMNWHEVLKLNHKDFSDSTYSYEEMKEMHQMTIVFTIPNRQMSIWSSKNYGHLRGFPSFYYVNVLNLKIPRR